MTKKIVSWLACMAVFLISWSCNTESFEESPAASANIPKFSIVTRSQMNSVKGLLERVGQMETKMSLQKGAAMKTRQDSLLEGATIVTETALLIQNGERKTYTFKVTRPGNPSYVENLAVKNDANGSYSGILIRYLLDNQEVINTSNGHGLDFSGKINIYPIEKLAIASRVVTQSSGCYSVTWETGVCASGQHHYGDACSLTGDNRAGVPQIVSVTNRCAGSAVGHLSEYSDGNQGGADYDTWVYYGPGGSTVQEPEDPCAKTKNMLNRPIPQQIINNVEAQALTTLSNVYAGEIGFKEKKDGTIAPSDVNAAHKVIFNDVTDGYGGYHNHTANGAHMFSPPDIADTLLGFAAAQDNVGDAYFGMIAAEWCTTCPNNKKILHYVIQYTGEATHLGNGGSYNFTALQVKQFENSYLQIVGDLADIALNGTTYVKNSAGDLNEKGLEKLFFETLKIMGMNGKVNLQRIEPNGTIYNVTLDSNNMPVGIPCP